MTTLDLATLPPAVAAQLRGGTFLVDHGRPVVAAIPWDAEATTPEDRAARLHVFGGLSVGEAAAHERCGRGALLLACERHGWPVRIELGADDIANDVATLERLGF